MRRWYWRFPFLWNFAAAWYLANAEWWQLEELHARLTSDWAELDGAPLKKWAQSHQLEELQRTLCESSACYQHRFLRAVREHLSQDLSGSLEPFAALFLATSSRDACCGLLKSIAWAVLEDWHRAKESWQHAEAHQLGLAAPGGVELLFLARRWGAPSAVCELGDAIQQVIDDWKQDETRCQHAAVLEIHDGAGGAGARCAALALSALKAACATCATCAPRSFVVGSAVEPIQEVGVEELPKDLELAIVIVERAHGQLQALKSLATYLNSDQVFGILIRLQNPRIDPEADDPLSIYEFLVWHGFRVADVSAPSGSVFRSVGEMQQAAASAAAAGAVMQESCLMLDRPNSWAEVDMAPIERRVSSWAAWAKRAGQRPRIGVMLSSNAFSHNEFVMGAQLLAHPHVQAIFPLSFHHALQLGPLGQTHRKQVVLFNQPPLHLLCRLAAAHVSIAIQSFRWLLRLARGNQGGRCSTPVKLHLEVDTGIGRTGLKGVLAAGHLVANAPWLRLEGLHTKLCCSNDASATARSLLYLKSLELRLRGFLRGLRGGKRAAFRVHVGGGLAANLGVAEALKHFRGWTVRLGEGIFQEQESLSWHTTISALQLLKDSTLLGYCDAGTDCGARPVAAGWAAVLPVGFAEFRGEVVWSSSGTEMRVLNSGASTTVVQLPSEAFAPSTVPGFRVGDVVTLCRRCPQHAVPWAVPRRLRPTAAPATPE
ncbi:Alanine racemase, partial [Durusdinium trenchii]